MFFNLPPADNLHNLALVTILNSLLRNKNAVKKTITNLYHQNLHKLQSLHGEVNREHNNGRQRIELLLQETKQLLKAVNPELSTDIDKMTYEDQEYAVKIYQKCEPFINAHADIVARLGNELTNAIDKFKQLDELRDQMNDVINELAENDKNNSHLLENIHVQNNDGCNGGRSFGPQPKFIS